jgi:ribose transport system permease protein
VRAGGWLGRLPRTAAAAFNAFLCKRDRTFVIAGIAAGIAAGTAGLIDASVTGSGNSNSGGGVFALQAIGSVAIGGTSIFGGVGSVWRTVVGVLFLALITNGMDLLAVDRFYQPIVTGVVIVAAVAISSLAERG